VVDTLVARGFVRFRELRDVPHGAAWFLQVAV
jgi:hypothetical protein